MQGLGAGVIDGRDALDQSQQRINAGNRRAAKGGPTLTAPRHVCSLRRPLERAFLSPTNQSTIWTDSSHPAMAAEGSQRSGCLGFEYTQAVRIPVLYKCLPQF